MPEIQDPSPTIPTKKDYHLQVALPIAVDFTFTYKSKIPLSPGTFVEVPFRNTSAMGVVWSQEVPLEEKKFSIKSIIKPYQLPALSNSCISFIEWVSKYTLTPLGNILKLCINTKIKHDHVEHPSSTPYSRTSSQSPCLSTAQEKAWNQLDKIISSASFKPTLLQGVTGCGKTEIYFKAIEKILESSGICLVLQPEITLTFDWVERFKKYFGFEPLVWHSNLTPKKRRITWQKILQGQAKVVVGARSALFLPFPTLDLIVVDEEHDTSYKQEEQALYHARDMAIVKAKYEDCPILLVSATPSLETQMNVKNSRYSFVYIGKRYGHGQMPSIELVDMKENDADLRQLSKKYKRTFYLSTIAQESIKDTIDKKEQVLIFLNRRGYAPLTICRSCGERLQCPNCTAWLVEHRYKNSLCCHHCGYSQLYPKQCPSCSQENTLAPCGPGVERIEEEISFLFPQARLCLMTSDTLINPKESEKKFKEIINGEVDIIIGTQVMAKGHTFPKLTLTIVVDSDLGLNTVDIRAGERTFQLLQQVSGRAGRSEKVGKVLLQTFDPQHPVMQALQLYNEQDFYKLEEEKRKLSLLPPFGRLASITVSATTEDSAKKTCQYLLSQLPPCNNSIKILGPAPATMTKRKRQYRWRFLVQTPKNFSPQNFIRLWTSNSSIPSNARISIDIDPQNFM